MASASACPTLTRPWENAANVVGTPLVPGTRDPRRAESEVNGTNDPPAAFPRTPTRGRNATYYMSTCGHTEPNRQRVTDRYNFAPLDGRTL
ncbi:hypothetical protein GCM10026982_49090 [Nocardiopsis aegyptia]